MTEYFSSALLVSSALLPFWPSPVLFCFLLSLFRLLSLLLPFSFLTPQSVPVFFFFSFSSSIACDEALVRSLARGSDLGVILEGIITGLVKNFDTTVCGRGVDDNKVGVGKTLCSCALRLHATC